MHGDRILVRIGRTGADGRARRDRSSPDTRAPNLRRRVPRARQRQLRGAHDERIQQWIEIPPGWRRLARLGWRPDWRAPHEIKSPADLDGMIVNVELLEFPEARSNAVGA